MQGPLRKTIASAPLACTYFEQMIVISTHRKGQTRLHTIGRTRGTTAEKLPVETRCSLLKAIPSKLAHAFMYSDKVLFLTALMTPDMANFSGKVHGGAILKLIDQVAYACASRYCGQYVVTLSIDQALFKEPICVGELVTFMAEVNFTGKTSMEVGIKVVTENTRLRQTRHAMTCFVTMVAMDAQGKPAPVPPLVLETDEDKRRFTAGKMRRQAREDFQRRYEDIQKHSQPK